MTSNKKKVLVIPAIHPAGLALIDSRPDVEYEVLETQSSEAIIDAVAEVDAIAVRTALINRAVIDAAVRLKIVARHGVGYDSVDVAALTARKIPLAIAIHSNAVSVAEHAMFMLLALSKLGVYQHIETRAGGFARLRGSGLGVEIAGKNLLIVGFGRIGSQVAPRASAFGMTVCVYDPYVESTTIERAGYQVVENLHAAVSEADAITCHTPLNDETRGIIGAEQFSLMKNNAFIINTARGGVVDEAALIAALQSKTIAGAGIDVFVGEPTPPSADHPLFAFDNVIVSPHSAGVTQESLRRTSVEMIQNVLDAFDDTLDPAVVVNQEILIGAPRSSPGD
ncbi:MAG: hydroxyacid dehydrogenase [Pseudomonadota bacterium]|nr:hydroxyacid dehydrogenase [Pseudomonadota bacterium]